jgi:protein-L-isoaspartate(D-aspartate) O-methyltransferase
MTTHERARKHMVETHLKRRGIRDVRVLAAMGNIPRERFIPHAYANRAYADRALPIDQQQTISQPYIVAYMTEQLALRGHERVLEIGTGSGYQAAVLSQLAAEVYSVERHRALAQQASRVLQDVGCSNVRVFAGDGSVGMKQFAPYDAILVTAAAPTVPMDWLTQLKDGGVLVAPVGDPGKQVIQRWTRVDDEYTHEALMAVRFVPLRGKKGWSQDTWAR